MLICCICAQKWLKLRSLCLTKQLLYHELHRRRRGIVAERCAWVSG